MRCKLYLYNGHRETYIGTFESKAKAESYYDRMANDLKRMYGYETKSIPVYVGVKKGRGA